MVKELNSLDDLAGDDLAGFRTIKKKIPVFKTPDELVEDGHPNLQDCLCGRNHMKRFRPHGTVDVLQYMLDQRATEF